MLRDRFPVRTGVACLAIGHPVVRLFSQKRGRFTIDIRIGFDVATQDIKTLWDKVEFSRGRSPEQIRLAIEQSNLLAHAWEGNRLVGTARVLTDGVYYATLWDVIVDPEFQGRGIGTALVRRAIEPFLDRGFSFIALFSAVGREGFYERLGFRPHPRAMTLNEPLWPRSE